jgi:hypothetical protein
MTDLSGERGMWDRIKQRLALLALAAIVVAAAVGFGIKAFGALRLAAVAGTWPTAEATVYDASRWEEPFDRQPRASAESYYEYHVGYTRYTGVVRVNDVPVARADELFKSYPHGKTFAVHYNPADPAESAVDVGPSGETWVHLLIAIAAALAAVPLIWAVFRRSSNAAGEEADVAAGEDAADD